MVDHVRWEVDYSGFNDEFDRLEKGIDYKLARQLDTIMEAAFADTQADTHIITGSLKASGKLETSINQRRGGRGRFASGYDWEGSIEYGGDAPGAINDPVEYAGCEPDRGQDHDFMRSADDYETVIEAAILDWFDD
jgi:hypothetical protein